MSPIYPETDGWDDAANENPKVRRIHRLFLFFGFFFLISALIAVYFILPERVVKHYPSGGKRVFYRDRREYSVTANDVESKYRRYRWTDTLYNTDRSVIWRVEIGEMSYTTLHFWLYRLDDISMARYYYYNENTPMNPATVSVVADAISNNDIPFYWSAFGGPFGDIADRLSDNNSIDIVSAFVNTSRHADSRVRQWSIEALEYLPKDPAYNAIIVQALIDRIDDDDQYIIRSAMSALSEFRSTDLLPHIIRGYEKSKLVPDSYGNDNGWYILLLINVGTEEALDELRRTENKFSDSNLYQSAILALTPGKRQEALARMSQSFNPDDWPMLDLMLNAAPAQAAEYANNNFDRYISPRWNKRFPIEAAPYFTRWLKEGSASDQRECAEILIYMRALPTAPEIFISDLTSDDYTQYKAIIMLGRIGDPSVIPHLERIAKDDANQYVRRAANDIVILLKSKTE